MIARAHGGVGLQHITKKKLEALALPVPPLAEQHRIVVKVDEVMALCDELEAAQAKRETQRDRLVAATLHGLNNGDSDAGSTEVFQQTARFYFNHLPRLTTKPEHIHQLRQTILNLAVRGKLVSQDDNDHSVRELWDVVQAERSEASRRGLLKAKGGPIPLEAARYQIPASWCWTSIGALITFGPQNGVSRKETKDLESPKALTLTATTSGRFDPHQYKRVPLAVTFQ